MDGTRWPARPRGSRGTGEGRRTGNVAADRCKVVTGLDTACLAGNKPDLNLGDIAGIDTAQFLDGS